MTNNTANSDKNPLLEKFNQPYGAVPFLQVKEEHYLPALQKAIDLAKAKIAQIKKNPATATFANVIVALEESSEQIDTIQSVFSNLELAHGSDEMSKIAKEFYPLLSAYSSDVTLDAELFAKIKVVYEQRQQLQLTVEQNKLLEKTYLGFSRNGALLNEQDKETLRQIDQQLSLLSPQFSENVLKATNAFEWTTSDRTELEGVPEGALEAFAMAAEAKGKKGQWLVNLQMPSFIPVMTYAQNRALREKLWRAYNSRSFKGDYDNSQLVLKTVQLRHQRARLLGYSSHADFVLTERMAKDPKTVQQFLNNLIAASKQAAQKDLEEVKAFAFELDGLKDFQPWDMAYYSEKLKEKKYAFNEEDLRPYFKLENVVQGVFAHAEKLYQLKFIERHDIEVYHPEVKVYEIKDSQKETSLGLFYTDYFPRETKKGGAWMTNFKEQGLWSGKLERPHVSIVCNFTKPTTTKPSLLSYDEVRTLFHEFGHALHSMLSQCTHRTVAGTNVFWDFVELPSQIMENWAGEKEGLDLFAKHYETQQTIPAELIEKLKRSQRFQAGWMSLRQLQFATLDMAWYSGDPSAITDVDQFENSSLQHLRLMPKIENTNTSVAFSHIFAGGYSAGYYSYKWAEVLDADAFEYFKEKGLFNAEVAKSFKENILSRGGSEHPMELYKKFRGREPDPQALLRRDGLI